MRVELGLAVAIASGMSPALAHGVYHHHEHRMGHHHHEHAHSGPHHHSHSHSQPQKDHEHLRPHTHIAYHHVEKACAADVERLCSPKTEIPQTFGDPLLDWVFLPQAPAPPQADDPAIMFDRMFNSFFGEPITLVTIYFEEDITPQEQAPLMVDSMAARMAADREPEEIPDLVQQLRKHGKELMQIHDEDSMHHRMGRRLTEMDTNTIQHHALLPFGCPKNRCLREAMAADRISEECAHSIRQYETTYILEEQLEHRQDIFVGMMWIYISVLSILLILLAKNYRSHRGQKQLRTKILRVIYSNPVLKKKVEQELGESVGNAPPLPSHVLRLMSSGGKDLRRQLQCLKRFHMVFFATLLVLVFLAPFWVLPICIMISIVRVVLLCFMNNEPVQGECECCCCGATTTDASNGLLTEAQECCGCCKGTGVCSVGCDSCCGPDGCCCGCCDGDCNCCSGKKNKAGLGCCSCCGCCDGSCACGDYKKMKDDCACCCCGVTVARVKEGNITDAQACCGCCKGTGECDLACASCCGGGGCCCCCGATPEAAKNGTLTDVQACCCCCGGSGCCSCCSCCGTEVKGRGKKHVVPSKTCVYEGIPLQVV